MLQIHSWVDKYNEDISYHIFRPVQSFITPILMFPLMIGTGLIKNWTNHEG